MHTYIHIYIYMYDANMGKMYSSAASSFACSPFTNCGLHSVGVGVWEGMGKGWVSKESCRGG